jgi:hypothetical protein
MKHEPVVVGLTDRQVEELCDRLYHVITEVAAITQIITTAAGRDPPEKLTKLAKDARPRVDI